MKSKFILTILVILFIFCGFLWAQDPEGNLDSCSVVCGVNGYPGSGTAEVCFQLRFKSDNTGANQIIGFLVPVLITGDHIVSIDTTVAKASAGSAAKDFDIPPNAYKYGNSDPTVPPFHILYSALDINGDVSITGEGLLANICLTVNDTGIVCIDTMSSEIHTLSFSTGAANYIPGWSGPFCCQVALCQERAGDANNDGMVNIGDIIYNVNHVFKGGAAPSVFCQGNVNADNKIDLADIIYEVNYVFKGGSAPQNSDLCCL